MKRIVALTLAALMLFSCALAETELTAEKKPATAITEAANAAVYQLLDFSDEQETEFAKRGLIAAPVLRSGATRARAIKAAAPTSLTKFTP